MGEVPLSGYQGMCALQAGSMLAFSSTPGCLENLRLAGVSSYRIVTALRYTITAFGSECCHPLNHAGPAVCPPVSTPLKKLQGYLANKKTPAPCLQGPRNTLGP